MKKRILIIPLILLLTTGCTCQYNLTIDDDIYKEEIILIGENSQEISQFQNQWQIPVDKEEYEIIAGSDTEYIPEGEIYKYNLSSNKITFNHNFSKSQFNNSTAVANCYGKLTITNHNDTIIISTSNKNNCFDKYPTLTNIKVNIKVDKPVISNNADSVNGNTYIWDINKDNINDSSINLVLEDNTSKQEGSQTQQIPTDSKQTNNKGKYDLYIFLIILLAIAFIGYKFIMKFKEKNNNID